MKQLNYILTFLIAMTAFWACTPDHEDLFDETAAERSINEIKRINDLLVKAPNGWRMEYYGTLTYGGYNVLMAFTDKDSVTVASQRVNTGHHAGLDTEGKCRTATSHFKLEQSMGVVLSLDEYNDVFHYFSNPNNVDGYGEKGSGFGGDFEFRIINASADSIVMRGKKHGDRIRMYPIAADQKWDQLMADIDETEHFMDSRNYTLGGDGYDKWVVAYKQYHSLIFQYRDSLGDLQTVTAPYVSTTEGFRFYAPIEVEGVTINGVQKGDSRMRYMLSGDSGMWLDSYLPSLAEYLYSLGSWFISYENMGPYTQGQWDKFLKGLAKKKKKSTQEKWKMEYARFGTYGGKDFGLDIVTNNYKEIKVFGSYELNEDETEIKCLWNGEYGDDGKDFLKDGLLDAQETIYGSFGRTFRIETDNQRDPTYLMLIDINEPDNWYKLVSTYVPFKED